MFKNNQLKIYFDMEMSELTPYASIISLGFVSECGDKLYLESTNFDPEDCSDWVQENVITNLSLKPSFQCYVDYTDNSIKHCADENTLRNDILSWIQMLLVAYGESACQFYCDCYAYDWVLLVELLTNGKGALDMPKFINYIPIDLSTALHINNIDPDINREEFAGIKDTSKKHNALFDAEVIKACYEKLNLL